VTGSGLTRYGVAQSRLGDQGVVVLHDRDDRCRVRIALHGAALLGFEVPLGGGLHDLAALDFRQPRRVGDSILDQSYASLAADPDGRIRTHLRDPASGLGLAVWQERGVMHAFTADTLSRDARRAIALEPMECMADAFNRPECADAIRLEAGAERRFRCGVEVARA